MENDSTIDREIKQTDFEKQIEVQKTDKYKSILISNIKTGLGDEIKKNPGKVKVVKKTIMQKIGLFFKKIFTSF